MFEFLFSTAHAQFTGTVGSRAQETTSKTQEGISAFFGTLVEKLPSWIAGAIVIFMAFAIASLTKKIVINKVAEHLEEDNQSVLILIGRTTYVGVLSIGLAIGLSFWGFKLDALLAAFGIGIAFALRDIMVNFISGVLILISRQFRIGDFIQVGTAIKGKVVEIQSRATILKGMDGTKIIVPNKDIFNKPVVSFTTNPFRRIDVVIGVDYRTNLGLATKIILDLLDGRKYVLVQPKPSVVVDSFSENSVQLKAKFWIESKSPRLKVKSKLLQDIHTSFQQAQITIPWPIHTVVYDKDRSVGPGKEVDVLHENGDEVHEEPNEPTEAPVLEPALAPTGTMPNPPIADTVATEPTQVATQEPQTSTPPVSVQQTDMPIAPQSTAPIQTPEAAKPVAPTPETQPAPQPVKPELPKSEDNGVSFLKKQ